MEVPDFHVFSFRPADIRRGVLLSFFGRTPVAKKSIEADPAKRKFGEKRDERRWARNFELAKYLNISEMTLWRWKHDPAYDFPRATKIDRMEFNDLDKVDAWLQSSPERRRGER
jgi:predicted DNA-binding transcriptional regulator AlpA